MKNHICQTQGTQVDYFTLSYKLDHVFVDPIHILQKLSVLFDFAFTNQSKFVTETGVYASICANFHHEMLNSSLDVDDPLTDCLIWVIQNQKFYH